MVDKVFTELVFNIEGKANQVLNVVLQPGQDLYVSDSQVICFSDNLKKIAVKRPWCEENKEQTPFRWCYANLSEREAHLTINNLGGSVVSLNSLLVKNMLIREDYILAHSSNVFLKKWTKQSALLGKGFRKMKTIIRERVLNVQELNMEGKRFTST
eukprot:TRINITY_DN6561_c0_g1_i1.p1 TRINITY_DN6561_c0_g1~~TRINITY_DN6561_c0_g1_i1.p1  ORF type:complete len:156 (-),score=40.40 TRINITY_DN6561_c0_g1_i1:273-740(-)